MKSFDCRKIFKLYLDEEANAVFVSVRYYPRKFPDGAFMVNKRNCKRIAEDLRKAAKWVERLA